MKEYKVKIEPEALADIQEITDWYNEAQTKLGERFQNTTIKQVDSLRKNPHDYATRYKEIRCMQVKKFPYVDVPFPLSLVIFQTSLPLGLINNIGLFDFQLYRMNG